MATAPVKPPLHNFGLSLQWGSKNHTTSNNHRHRRPVSAEPEPSADDHHNNDSSPPPPSHSRVGSRTSRGGGHRFPLTSCSTEKLPKPSPPPPPPPPQNSEKEGGDDDSDNDNEEAKDAAEEAEVQKRWKLRPRRAAAMTSKAEVVHEAEKQSEQAAPAPKSMRLRGLAAEGPSVEKKEKRKFWIALSKDEIEEDIYSMTGSRPARRPKKRPKNVQKQLDNCFPGLWLVGFSADAYKGAESSTKK